MAHVNNKPIFAHQIGAIRVAIWEQPSKSGSFFTTTIVRRYKDPTNGEWKDSNSFSGLSDLALVREAARLAREWITNRTLAADGGEGDSDSWNGDVAQF